MQLFSSLFLASAATLAVALVPVALEDRSIRSSCTTPDGKGTCQKTSNCKTQGFNLAGHCPHDANDVQCCVKKTCSTSSGSGICLNTGDGCSGGAFISGSCPGDSSIKCCVKGAKPPPPTHCTGPAIVAAAESQKGIPYVFGGGGCNGKSKGGYDCSGLTQYSVCTACHFTIPRTAQTQYHSSLGKHLPRAQAQAGDMLFWATNGDCKNRVAHVGIFVRKGIMVNAAHTGTLVREQAIWTSSGGESICPDAVRFWK
ncbi:hypothetical protein MMC29_002619 [Sticta canariensis]|nr:hypothetical protein [Sticta canariensis]